MFSLTFLKKLTIIFILFAEQFEEKISENNSFSNDIIEKYNDFPSYEEEQGSQKNFHRIKIAIFVTVLILFFIVLGIYYYNSYTERQKKELEEKESNQKELEEKKQLEKQLELDKKQSDYVVNIETEERKNSPEDLDKNFRPDASCTADTMREKENFNKESQSDKTISYQANTMRKQERDQSDTVSIKTEQQQDNNDLKIYEETTEKRKNSDRICEKEKIIVKDLREELTDLNKKEEPKLDRRRSEVSQTISLLTLDDPSSAKRKKKDIQGNELITSSDQYFFHNEERMDKEKKQGSLFSKGFSSNSKGFIASCAGLDFKLKKDKKLTDDEVKALQENFSEKTFQQLAVKGGEKAINS